MDNALSQKKLAVEDNYNVIVLQCNHLAYLT